MLTNRRTRLQIGVVAGSVLYAIVFIGMLIVHPGSEQFYQAFHNSYQILPALFAGVCGVVCATKGHHLFRSRRIGWFLIGLAGLSFAIGQSTWTYYESIRGIEVPFPGPPDAGYLGAVPLLLLGVLLLFGSMHLAGRTRLILDSGIAASSAGVMSWYFLVGGLWADSEVPLIGKFIGVAYPLGDIAGLFGALVLFYGATSSKSLRRSSALLAGGMVLLGFADSLFVYYNLSPSGYQTGSWFDWGWSFGWILIGFASLSALWWPQQEPKIVTKHAALETGSTPKSWHSLTLLGLIRVLTPYTLAVLSVGFIAYYDYQQPKDGAYYLSYSVLMLGLWIIFLVVLRQVFTLLENQFLTVQLQSFNSNLEQLVLHRTAQLTALHQLTIAVNDTLEVDQVLDAATRHTQQALQSDAVVLFLSNTEEIESGGPSPIIVQRGLENYPQILEYVSQQPVVSKVTHCPLPADWFPELTQGGEEQVGDWIRAPLLWQSQPMGMINVIRKGNSFGPTDVDTLHSIGIEVGTAYRNARTYSIAIEAADQDSVTGLLNHRAIHQRMESEMARADRLKLPLTIMMMDVNNFKLFNDTYGHPVGDQVLKKIAHILEVECRKYDILGRYGGDEFIAILPDTDEDMAMEVAQRLQTRMSQEGFQRRGEDRTIPVTLSFGMATHPTDSTNRHELVTIADANLYKAKLSDVGIKSSSETQRSSRKLRTNSSFEVLDAMVTAVDNKDRYTRRHSEDVTEYSLWIAEELGLSEETMRVLRMGGLLHDVGKIGVPEEILRKPGRLTVEEYEVMKRHPILGELIVGGVPGMSMITDIVRAHHERWDGKGYPDGLHAEDTPLLGRLLAVADAFSAMTTSRPYRQGMEWEPALEEIRANTGTQFDPQMTRAFLNAVQKRRALQLNGSNGKYQSNSTRRDEQSNSRQEQ